MTTALGMVIEYLERHGYDGLYDPGECSCLLGELVPCGSDFSDCEPGYKCPCECGEGCDFHIGPAKHEEAT